MSYWDLFLDEVVRGFAVIAFCFDLKGFFVTMLLMIKQERKSGFQKNN